MRTFRKLRAAAAASFVLLLAQTGATQQSPLEWPMHRHDSAGTAYSPAVQINAGNVARLAVAWSYSLLGTGAPVPGRPPFASQATPIVVDGVMYVPAADRIVALDPETGKVAWQFAVEGTPPSRRGVAYAPGGAGLEPRLYFTSGDRLRALNARTGAPLEGFGRNGVIEIGIPYNSVPFVSGDVVVVGANTPPGTVGGIGNARAFHARTGARLWEFSSVPQPGAVGHETWEGDSWKGRLGVNAWPFYFTVDEARGLLFIPLASPIGGNYGGDRKGANLFGNSVVAVDLKTGVYKWHFQTIHHDLWDADPPAPPGLIDVRQNGKTVPALALTTKSGYLYLLNRETGQPLFGVNEQKVPASDVPGEAAFPTQPIPVKPPPMARVAYSAADLVTAADTTPEHARACAEFVEKIGGVHNAGPFTPWRYRGDGASPPPSLVFPGGLGGPNWGGTAWDPNLGYVFVVSQDVGALGWVERAKEGAPFPFQKATPGRATFDVTINGVSWPCQKPPWGRLTAVDAATGDIAWQIPLGVTDQMPDGKQQTGRPALAGAIATASGLLFVASTDDNRFRALDARSGKQLWEARLDRRGNADPITYQSRNGKQYVAIVATDALIVYALP